MNIPMLAALMRSSLENNIHHLLGANLDGQVCILTAQVGSEPLLILVEHSQPFDYFEGRQLTPGLISTKESPSLAYCRSYCALSMFNAAFDILYAGVGESL